MKVKRSSWHFKAWNWMQTDTVTEPPTVCGYWGTILFLMPLVCSCLVLFSPLILIIWLGDKLEERFKGKSVCPFGRINIE